MFIVNSVILSLLLLFQAPPLAGQVSVKKFPNEAAIFTWVFPPAEEPNITGFKIYSSTNLEGPFTTPVTTLAVPSIRTATTNVVYPPGSTSVFYVVRPYKIAGSETLEAADSNVVEAELSVPSATDLQVH